MSGQKQKIAAFFDLDETITSLDSFRLYLKHEYLFQMKNWILIPNVFFWGVMRKLRLISLQKFKEKALLTLVDENKNSIQEKGLLFFENELKNFLRVSALKCIQSHKDRGHLIYIVSASPDIYVDSIADYLGCDGYLCTRLKYDNDSYVGKFEGNDLIGNEKVKVVYKISSDKNIDLRNSYAYSDHHSDLPMLHCVGNPVVVSPTTSLKSSADINGWTISYW